MLQGPYNNKRSLTTPMTFAFLSEKHIYWIIHPYSDLVASANTIELTTVMLIVLSPCILSPLNSGKLRANMQIWNKQKSYWSERNLI